MLIVERRLLFLLASLRPETNGLLPTTRPSPPRIVEANAIDATAAAEYLRAAIVIDCITELIGIASTLLLLIANSIICMVSNIVYLFRCISSR